MMACHCDMLLGTRPLAAHCVHLEAPTHPQQHKTQLEHPGTPYPPECSVVAVDTDHVMTESIDKIDLHGIGAMCPAIPRHLAAVTPPCEYSHSKGPPTRVTNTTTLSLPPTQQKTPKRRLLPQFSLPGSPPNIARMSVASLPACLAASTDTVISPTFSPKNQLLSRHYSLSNSASSFSGSARSARAQSKKLSDGQKALVRSTWQAALSREQGTTQQGTQTPALDLFEAIFSHLFALAPEAKLIACTRVSMCVKLARAIGLLLSCLDNPNRLRDALANLAGTHVCMGVTPGMFTHLGTALVMGLRERLCFGWTPEIAEAWHVFYHMASDMLQIEMGKYATDPKRVALFIADRVGPHQPRMLKTWAEVAHTHFLADFYRSFFGAMPEAKPLFQQPEPPHSQLHTATAELLRVVDQPEKLAAQLWVIGRLHSRLGLAPGMNTHFQQCFVETLKNHVWGGLSREEECVWGYLLGSISAFVVASNHGVKSRGKECTVS